MLSFKIRKPYTNSASTLVTETIMLDTVTVTNYYARNPGRLIDFKWESITGEQTPTTT